MTIIYRGLILIFCLISLSIVSQNRRGNIWYFGSRAGIDFNSGIPSPLLNSSMDQFEGSSCIADEQGDLLFYTNGIEVWDRMHNPMPNGNGLYGGVSSSTSAVIAPVIGDPSKYYIFTAAQDEGTGIPHEQIRYSVVDMCLNNGMGDIDTNKKNILVLDTASEKIAITKHSNKTDYWVVSYKNRTGQYHAFLVTKDGISSQPVISLGYPVLDDGPSGQMKFSGDGKNLIACFSRYGVIMSYFDNSTGKLSQFETISDVANAEVCYGIAFSPNDSIIYATNIRSGTVDPDALLYRYDRYASDVVASRIELLRIPFSENHDLGHLLLASDGRIYSAQFGAVGGYSDSILVIETPNSLVNPNVKRSAFYLNGKKSTIGMPYLFHDFAITDVQTEQLSGFAGADRLICSGDTVQLGITSFNGYTYQWEPSEKFANSSEPNPTIVADSTTIYACTINTGCSTFTDSVVVIIKAPYINLGNDTVLCKGQSMVLDAGVAETYNWSTGSNSQILQVFQPGNYSIELFDSDGCVARDTIDIKGTSLLVSGNKDGLCEGEKAILSVSGGNVYSWEPFDNLYYISDLNQVMAFPEITTTYSILALDSICLDTVLIDITLNVIDCKKEIFIPNAFSPNQDGVNDLLKVATEKFTEIRFELFDRKGNKIYSNGDIQPFWDIENNTGEVYIYKLMAVYADTNISLYQTGNIHLIK